MIQSRYTLLDLKCNKMEVRLCKLIKQMLGLIVADINDRHSKTYYTSDIEIKISRDTMIDETEVEEREKTKAERKQVELDTILDAAARLDDETVLKAICDLLEIDYDEIKQRVEVQDYLEPPQKEVIEGGQAE